jgi:hypothetical protein
MAAPGVSSLQAQTGGPKTSAAASPGQVEVVGCVDRKDGRFELTNAFWYVLYYLTGRTAGLENHLDDEVTLRGTERDSSAPSGRNQQAKTLDVTSVQITKHKNPEGVRPSLGRLATWTDYHNNKYGLSLRYPSTFAGNAKWEYSTIQSNFLGKEQPPAIEILKAAIPRNVYPDSNFVDGGFAVFVDPDIHTEGTCSQFRHISPEHTSSEKFGGITYTRTLDDGAATGTTSFLYSFHTFQNGVCYEFAFAFAEANGTGMDTPCEIQWVSEENIFELIGSVLGTVSFSTPESKQDANASRKPSPSITSFGHSPAARNGTTTVADISWQSIGTDYVQLRYACVTNLHTSILKSSSLGDRYDLACDHVLTNFPPTGSFTLLLANFNSQPVDLILTIEPFVAGVGSPQQAKTITISVAPEPPLKPRTSKPVPHK